MKWIFLYSFLIALNISASYSKENFVAIAIKEYAENIFVKNGKTIEIFYNSKNVSLVDDTIKLLGGLAYRVTQVNANVSYKFKTPAILIFDKLESFTNLDQNITRSEFDNKKRHLLIVCPKLKTREVLRNLPGEDIRNNQYLIEGEGQIYLKESVRYTPQACNETQLIEINRFSKRKLKWTTTKFSNEKVDNFYGCTLRVCFYLSSFLEKEFSWTTTEDGKVKNIHMEGYLFNLAEELSRRLNFTMETWLFRPGPNITSFSRFLNLTDMKEYEEHPWCDWSVDLGPIIQEFYTTGTFSKPLFTEVYTIVVPPGAFYTSEEKFILPFDELTWILLVFTFATAFSVVIVVRLSRSPTIAAFVQGENVSTPGLNIVAAFMGIGQLKLPAKSIARMMLINFVIFSLIMRTAYQGVYFELLTTNPQKKPINSMNELVKKNFPVYTTLNEVDREFFNLDALKPLKVISETKAMSKQLLIQIQNSSFEGSLLRTTIFLEKMTKYQDTIKFNSLGINILSLNIVIEIHQSFDPKVVETGFIESGILENWSNRIKYFAELKVKKAKESKRVVLTMDHLSTGFTIWLCALSISVIAFIGELCHFWLRRNWVRLTRSNNQISIVV